MKFAESIHVLLAHAGLAVAAALLFAAGAAFAIPVMRWRVEFLLAVPRSFAGWLARVLKSRPSTPRLALFIFCFNGAAIFVYMMTGLIPGLAIVVAFLTGLNVALASMLGRNTFSATEVTLERLSFLSRACALLTFILELPCFWFAMAMGIGLELNVVELARGADAGPLLARMQAYALIILPALALSALAESYAITSTVRPQE